ncbi:TPA: hypothetical protein OQU49_004316, partial [Shigella flexneri]|nr:hypothetical protein [Shigella flexneri]
MTLDALIFICVGVILLILSGLVARWVFTQIVTPAKEARVIAVCWSDDLLPIAKEYAHPRMMLLASGLADTVEEARQIDITLDTADARRQVYAYKFRDMIQAEEFSHKRLAAYMNRTTYRVLDTDDPRVVRVSWDSQSGNWMEGMLPLPVTMLDEPRFGYDYVVLGLDEWGNEVRVRLDSHFLISGETGSGKGSIIWTILAQLSRRPDVALYGVDLKFGLEFLSNDRIWADRVMTTKKDLAEFVGILFDEMVDRASVMVAKGIRKWEPTPEAPLRYVFIDEGMDLADMARDKEYKDDMATVDEIHRKARATGIFFVSALQNANLSTWDYA